MTVALGFLRSLVAVISNPAALLLIAMAFVWGDHRGADRANGKCNAAALQARIDALVADQKTTADAAKRFEAEAKTNADRAEKNAAIVKEISDAAKRGSCRLSDADERRVWGIH